jgi:hypothetical protein
MIRRIASGPSYHGQQSKSDRRLKSIFYQLSEYGFAKSEISSAHVFMVGGFGFGRVWMRQNWADYAVKTIMRKMTIKMCLVIKKISTAFRALWYACYHMV